MSKKVEQTEETQQPDYVKELLEKGTVMITAESRNSLYKKAETLVGMIPAGTKWTRGIVEHDNECTTFTQIYSVIKN